MRLLVTLIVSVFVVGILNMEFVHSLEYSVKDRPFLMAATLLQNSMEEKGGYDNVTIATAFDFQEIDECLLKSDHQVVLDLTLEYSQYLSKFQFKDFKDVFEFRYFYVCKKTEAVEGDFHNGYAVTHTFISAYDPMRVQIYYEYLR